MKTSRTSSAARVDLVTEDALLKDPDFAEGISGQRVSLYAA